MLSENYSTVRQNLKTFCDIVTEEDEDLIITRTAHKDVVMISLEKYNRIMQSQSLFGILPKDIDKEKAARIKKYYDKIKSIANE